MTDNSIDQSVLESRIVHIAHIVDKNLAAYPEQLLTLRAAYAPSLGKSLHQWSQQGFETNSAIAWAKEILAELESPSVAPSRLDQQDGAAHVPDDRVAAVMDVLRARRTVRRWTAEHVPQTLVEQLLEAARWAPSSGNRQAVRIVVLTSPDARAAVVRMKEKFLLRAPLILLVGVDLRVYGEAERHSGLPFLDVAAAIQNILLAAHALGLGCCWSKFCEDDWDIQPELYFQAKAQLRLPGYFRPASLVAVGWPSAPTKVPPRKKTAEFTRFNDEGFPPDDFPDWRPKHSHRWMRRWRELAARVRRRINRLLQRK